MTHEEVIATLTEAVRELPGVRGLFLSGSYASGLADANSDIDFVMVTDDGATDEVAAMWKAAVSQMGEIVLWWDRKVAPVLINAIIAWGGAAILTRILRYWPSSQTATLRLSSK